jgi:hypothetical protein
MGAVNWCASVSFHIQHQVSHCCKSRQSERKKSTPINIEGNVYIFCIFRSLWHILYLHEEWFVKEIRTTAQRITTLLSLMFHYFSVFFSVFSICMLIKLKYLYVFVTRCLIHTVTFLFRSLFIVICWLLDKVHIGGGVTLSM